MKAITILQPYASLIPAGAKKIETRGWKTSYRGKIAIHAGLGMQYLRFAFKEPFKTALQPVQTSCGGYNAESFYLGHVIAIADLVKCLKVIDWTIGDGLKVMSAILEDGQIITDNELEFGDYAPGRYAWILANIQAIKPVPAKGMQRLWNWAGEAV